MDAIIDMSGDALFSFFMPCGARRRANSLKPSFLSRLGETSSEIACNRLQIGDESDARKLIEKCVFLCSMKGAYGLSLRRKPPLLTLLNELQQLVHHIIELSLLAPLLFSRFRSESSDFYENSVFIFEEQNIVAFVNLKRLLHFLWKSDLTL